MAMDMLKLLNNQSRFNQHLSPLVAVEPTESQAIAVFWAATIPAIPDLVSLAQARSGMTYETALNQLLQAQQSWIRQLHNDSRFTLSLRIISSGQLGQELTFGLVGKTEGQQEAETIQAARNFFNRIQDTFPNGYPLQPCTTPEAIAQLRLPFMPTDSLPSDGLADLRRSITPLQTLNHPDALGKVGQAIYPWNSPGGTFQDLFRALACHPAAAGVAINLRPTQLTPDESIYIAEQARSYARAAHTSISISDNNRVQSTSQQIQEKWPEAEEASQAWTERGGAWRSPFELSVSLISASPLPQSVIAALKAAVEGDSEAAKRGQAELLPAQSKVQKIAVRQNWADLTLHRWGNGYDLDRLPWLFSAEEVHSLFRLPIADRAGVWGLPSAVGAGDARLPQVTSEAPAEITIGSLKLSKKHLTQHLLISGVPGSGKTNTSLYLLEQLWREHRIPWMVLEPAKTEYRGLQSVASLQDDLVIFTLGDERTAPFRFNPFELAPGISLDAHIGVLTDLFSVSMSMWGPLPNVVEQLIIEAYRQKGFTLLGDNEGLIAPTFSDLSALVSEIVPRLGYKRETTDEISAALSVRLNKFCRGALGRMLNTAQSVSFEKLMERPVILEMSQMTNTDDRAFVMGLILNRCYQYWTARRHEAAGELKHLLLVEEAHNLLGQVSESSSQEQANPKGKAVRNFANMLAEVRGFGQGIAIAEQNPEGLVTDVLVNTNLKIAHRIVEASNRETLGKSMLLTQQQETGLASLGTGQFLYYLGGQSEPAVSKAPNFKDADNGFDPRLTDTALALKFEQQAGSKPTSAQLLHDSLETHHSQYAEQAEDIVRILCNDKQYQELKQDLIFHVLAAPYGHNAKPKLTLELGKILLSQGKAKFNKKEIEAILDSSVRYLSLEAARAKGKLHGWSESDILTANRILQEEFVNSSETPRNKWLQICSVPQSFLSLGIPDRHYQGCSAPGAFRYESWYAIHHMADSFREDMKNRVNHKDALERWASQDLIYSYLNPRLKEEYRLCRAIQLTRGISEEIQIFMTGILA